MDGVGKRGGSEVNQKVERERSKSLGGMVWVVVEGSGGFCCEVVGRYSMEYKRKNVDKRVNEREL